MFKHENRFAQLYDQQKVRQQYYENPADKPTDDIDRMQHNFEQSLLKNENVPLLLQERELMRNSRTVANHSSRQSLQLQEAQDEYKPKQVDHAIQGLKEEEFRVFGNRLSYFIRDCDIYTSMLL